MKQGIALQELDQFSRRTSFFHKLHPLCLFVTTMVVVIWTASLGKYDLPALVPLLVYPLVLLIGGQFSIKLLGRLLLPVLIFVFFLALPNPFLDRELIDLGNLSIAGGWVSAASLLLRSLVSVSSVLLFIAFSGISGLVYTLKILHLPDLIIDLFVFTYRYIHTLLREASMLMKAYSLRSVNAKGISFPHWGSIIGQWFIRSTGRAERIHNAMLCRGGSSSLYRYEKCSLQWQDMLWLFIWLVYFGILILRGIL